MGKYNAVELLKEKNIKITKERTSILEEIININTPFNANELYLNISSSIYVDLATVYRTLHTFKEKGLVKEILYTNGFQYYGFSYNHNSMHPHFICENCKKVYCLGSLSQKGPLYFTDSMPNFTVKNVAIIINGICKDCKNTIAKDLL